jgi:hypothetical protein
MQSHKTVNIILPGEGWKNLSLYYIDSFLSQAENSGPTSYSSHYTINKSLNYIIVLVQMV